MKIFMLSLLGFLVLWWLFFMWALMAGVYGHNQNHRPWGKLTDKQAHTEVLIHRVDPHKVYTCEEDPIIEDQTPGHYAVIDQVEALDAGYQPNGEGYCESR